MKKTHFLLTIFLILCCTIYSQKGLKQYGIKSGIVEYKLEGTTTGTQKIYFDEYGNKSAAYSNTTTNGIQNKGWVITHNDMQYMYDRETSNKGTKMKNPLLKYFSECEDIELCVKKQLNDMGYQKEGEKTFLGKNCQIWKSKMGEMLVWKGIMLRNEMEVLGKKSIHEAISINVNVNIPESKFEIPKDIEFAEMPSFF